MPPSKRENMSGWGHTPVQECVAFRPEKLRDLRGLVATQPTLIARGLGRAYGDAALLPGGVVRMERFDHLIEFDAAQGIVRAQAGVTLAALMELFIPKGWLVPVLPGTRHATIGGAVACNVHGKNHWREGDLAEHVVSVRLTIASGETIECSPQMNADIFWATAGGMGMTGIIEEVTLKLKPIASASLEALTYRVDSVHDMIAAFEHYKNSSDYMVGWIDHMATDDIGRGVFEAARHITEGEGGDPLSSFSPMKTRLSVPCFLPPFILNRYTMALYNKWRFRRASHDRESEIVDLGGFFHPLDGIRNWNRLYGRRGFFQYQCLLPETPDVAAHIHDLLAAIQRQKLFSFLAVIKYHRDGQGLLTFPIKGYSIALDFPNTARVRNMIPQLDRWVAGHGGRVYLAKDAMLAPDVFMQMYGNKANEWRDLIRDLDPTARFTSLMCERLQWKQ